MVKGEGLRFFFNDTATTEIYTLSLHDALPISLFSRESRSSTFEFGSARKFLLIPRKQGDRKSTRLNSSHSSISYAVFCWKRKQSRSKTQGIQAHTRDLDYSSKFPLSR